MDDTTIIVATLIAYGLAMLAIGAATTKKSSTKEGFLVGGRQLGGVLGAFAYASSTSSAWVLLGFSGFVYSVGLQALWLALGVLIGFWLVWGFAGRKLSEEGRSRGLFTLADFLSLDLAEADRARVRLLSAAMIVFCFVFYVASQFQAAGASLESVLGLNAVTGLLIGAGIVLAYTFLGGFHAVVWTDAIQGALMAGIAILLPIGAIAAGGGFEAVLAKIQSEPSQNFLDPWGGAAGLTLLGVLLGFLGVGLGSLGQPHNLNWLIALRDEKALKRGLWLSLLWGVIVYGGMGLAGFAARAVFGPPGEQGAEGMLFRLAETLNSPLLQGVVAAAVLAAIMSTVDAQLLTTSAAVTHDMGFDRKLSPKHQVLLSRGVILAVAIGALILSAFLPDTIFRRVLFAWSALGAAFGPIVVARVLGLKPEGGMVLFAMTTGFGLTILFNVLPDGPGDVWEYFLPWAPALAILVLGPKRA